MADAIIETNQGEIFEANAEEETEANSEEVIAE